MISPRAKGNQQVAGDAGKQCNAKSFSHSISFQFLLFVPLARRALPVHSREPGSLAWTPPLASRKRIWRHCPTVIPSNWLLAQEPILRSASPLISASISHRQLQTAPVGSLQIHRIASTKHSIRKNNRLLLPPRHWACSKHCFQRLVHSCGAELMCHDGREED